MGEELQIVEVFVGTSIRGPAKGTGRVMYIMRSRLASGTEYEGAPEVAEYDEVTESHLVLCGIKDALQRLNYACRVKVYTECMYVAAVFNQRWLEKWSGNGWKSEKDKDVKDAELWREILEELEEGGHELEVVAGAHEWCQWMRWNLPLVKAYKDIFLKIPKE